MKKFNLLTFSGKLFFKPLHLSIEKVSMILVSILLLPLFLFFFSWFETPYNILLISIISFYLWSYCKESYAYKDQASNFLTFTSIDLVLGMGLLLCWIIYGGIGHWGYQNFDYMKHNVMSYELLHGKWPIEISLDGQYSYYLVYYLGEYLVPSALSSLVGEEWLNFFIFLESFIILLSILFLLAFFINKNDYTKFAAFKLTLIMVLWIMFGGLDVLALIKDQQWIQQFGELPEWWAGGMTFQYTGQTDLLYWVPQHALGGWSLSILFYRELFFARWKNLALLISIGCLWSPFVVIGLIPLLILFTPLLLSKHDHFFLKKNIFFFFSPLLVAFAFWQYYRLNPHPIPFAWQPLKLASMENFLNLYLPFIFLEFVILAIFLFVSKKMSKELKKILMTQIPLILVLPWIYYGLYSDLSMRASIVGLFFLMMSVLFFWLAPHDKSLTKQINNIYLAQVLKLFMIFYFIIGSYSAISDFYRAQKLKQIIIPYAPFRTLGKEIQYQYLGVERELNIFNLSSWLKNKTLPSPPLAPLENK